MILKDLGLAKSLLVMLVMILFLLGFEVKKMENVSLTGSVETVSRDSKFIVVDGTRIAISSKTKIVDEKGIPVKLESLTHRSSIAVEATHNSSGILADKIIVKTQKSKP
jgi:hypothetical protein